MSKRAVVAGHICLDIIPGVDHHFDLLPGRLYEVGAPTMATGGAVSNTGLTMQILGVPVTLMGKIGADNFGRLISNILSQRAPGSEKGMTVDPGSISSYTVVINIPGTDRMFLHCQGANATYGADDINYDAVAEADLFHFGYPCFMTRIFSDGAAELKKMYRRVKELGVTTSMDPGMPDPSGPAGKVNWRQVLAEVLPDVDVFMPSADELLYMLHPEKFGEGDNISASMLSSIGDELIGMGAAVAAVKLGKRGMYLRSAGAERLKAMGKAAPADIDAWAGKEMIFPTFTPDKFMGATGAGDSSIGAFLTGLLRGLTFREAGFFAAAVGACNVEAPDSLSGIRTWEATNQRIASGWKTNATEVSEPGWTLAADNVWEKN